MLLLGSLLDSLLYTRVDFLLDEMLDLVSIVMIFPCFFCLSNAITKVIHFCYELVVPRHRKMFSSHLIGFKYRFTTMTLLFDPFVLFSVVVVVVNALHFFLSLVPSFCYPRPTLPAKHLTRGCSWSGMSSYTIILVL